MTLAERFDRLTTPEPTSGCVLWTGSTTGDSGYGWIAVHDGHNHRRVMRAHRVAWEMANGAVPPGLWVLHRCDNRACVNPRHLFLGTARDNVRDMIAKGRNRAPRGIGRAGALLTEDEVVEARHLRAAGMSRNALAKRYGVAVTTIRSAVVGLAWKGAAGPLDAPRCGRDCLDLPSLGVAPLPRGER